MYSETELRDALEQSAARADNLVGKIDPPAAEVLFHPAGSGPTHRSRRWTRVALPAAAAGVVAAVTLASVFVARSNEPGHQAAAPTHQVSTKVPPQGPRVDASKAVDLVQVRTPGVVNHEINNAEDSRSGAETLHKPLGRINAISLTVVPASSKVFDSSRIPRDRPVQIAGTTGYYSNLKLFPIDGNHGKFSDKWLKHWTIAFQTPNRDWAFAYFDNADTPVSIDDPTRIVAEYNKLHVSYVSGQSKIGYKFGYLPAGVQFTGASFDTGITGPGNEELSLADGNKGLDVQLIDASTVTRVCAAGDKAKIKAKIKAKSGSAGGDSKDQTCQPPPVQREVGKYVLEVTGQGYSRAVQQRVVDSIVFAKDLSDSSTYYTIEQALGG